MMNRYDPEDNEQMKYNVELNRRKKSFEVNLFV